MKKQCEMTCNKTSDCYVHGWLSKKFLGLCLGAWIILFAILPYTAQGVSWTVNMVSSIWRPTERVMVVEPVEMRPVRAEMTVPRGVRRGVTRTTPATSE